MAAFAGIVLFDGATPPRSLEEKLVRALAARRRGRVAVQRAAGFLLVHRGETDCVATAAGRPFAADARLDNCGALVRMLGLPPADEARLSDADLLRLAYLQRGEAGIAACLGGFAFADWDAGRRVLTLGRDCLGNKSLFFHRGDGFVAFATVLSDLALVPQVPWQIDETAMADYLALNQQPTGRTLYRGIERVLSRQMVRLTRDGARAQTYWSPQIGGPDLYRCEAEYVAHARALFDTVTADAIRRLPSVAISCSGGLDSSAIAATVARLTTDKPVVCYSVVPPGGATVDVGPDHYADERSKLERLKQRYPALDLRYFAQTDLHPNERDATRFFLTNGYPSLGTVILGPYSHLYDAVAADGHKALLVGNRGNWGLTWSGSRALLAALAAGKFSRFGREFAAAARRNGIWPTLRREIAGPLLPPALRRTVFGALGRDPDDVARHSGLNPSYIADRQLAQKWRREGHDPWWALPAFCVADYRARVLFDVNQQARDTRGMSGELSGFDYCDVQSDRRLLEFALQVPEYLYRKDGIRRAFARTVFADRLPPDILNERRRGAQGVDWFRRLDARKEALAETLRQVEATPLAAKLIDIDRLKRLMRDWPADEQAAQLRAGDYRHVMMRALHAGQFIRWVEGGNG